MKPATTLKELLKPPFSHDHCGVGEVFVGVNQADYGSTRIAQVRGWGFFQYFENGDRLQDEFKDFVVQALNEKWERDYGEPLRWEKESAETVDGKVFWTKCPKCDCRTPHGYIYHYCPSCGQRLLPPEGN
jgi:hypothetical protein